MAQKRHFIQRTSDGKYLQSNGSWVTGTNTAAAYSNRQSVGTTIQSKPSGTYRMTKEYVVG